MSAPPLPPRAPAPRALYRLCTALVDAAATLVPGHRRDDWRAEWQGELWHRIDELTRRGHLDVRARVGLVSRTLGALPHALWTLGDEWRLDMLWQDLAYAIRTTLRRPAFTSLVVLTLALGIGANSAMFSIVNAVLIKPLPYGDPERLVYLYGSFKASDQASVSPPDFLDYRARNTVFESLAAAMVFGSAAITGGDAPERVRSSIITSNFFATLGVAPLLGRSFVPDEEQGEHDVAILSYGLWQSRFGGDRGVVGTTATIDGRPHTIVGVMPPTLDRTLDIQLWKPIPFGTPGTSVRRFHNLRGFGRLKPGVSLAQAQQQLDVIARQLEAAYPENETWKVRLVPYRDVVVGDVGRALIILLGAVTLVLLIACGNVASLLLARATSRSGEMAIRTALGASRTRLVRQLLTESLLLGVTAGAAGLALAVLLLRGVRAVGVGILPRLREIDIDATTLAFTIALSLLTSFVFGLAPAVHGARQDLAAAMKSLGRTSSTRAGVRARDALVIGQVALSLVLLIGAGLLIRSLWLLQRVEPGFDAERVFTARIILPATKYPTKADADRFWVQLFERVRAIPGVEAAAGTTMLPLAGGGDTYFYVDGRPPVTDADKLNAEVNVVTDDYFSTMRIPVRAGRVFGPIDREDGAGVVIINESLARRLFPAQSAVGERLVVDFGQPFRAEIVGVAADVRAFGLANPAPGILYFSQRQPAGFGFGFMNLVARSRGSDDMTPAVRAALRELEPDVPLAEPRTMEKIVSDSMSEPRFRARLLAAFAGSALLLSIVGLYGVLAYSVTQRTREMGIRIALGASVPAVFGLVMRQGMTLVAAGIVIGLAGALGATRLLSRLLFDVGNTDPVVFAGVSLTLALVGLAACLVPARRATRVSPLVALRAE